MHSRDRETQSQSSIPPRYFLTASGDPQNVYRTLFSCWQPPPVNAKKDKQMTKSTDIDYGVSQGRGGRLHGGARVVARCFVGLGTALAGGLVIAGIVGLASQN